MINDDDLLKNIVSMDLKIMDVKEISDLTKPIERILKRYELGVGDYEESQFVEALFIRFGWSNRYKDTIFSFRAILYSAISIFSEKRIKEEKDEFQVVFFTKYNQLKYKFKNKKDNSWSKEKSYRKLTLYRKCYKEKTTLNAVVSDILKSDISWQINKFAELCDSISNFTPHPGFSFNQAKGFEADVVDSLNLMIDKIQNCIDENKSLKYSDFQEPVRIEKLKNWKEWFIKNREVYCLDDFYYFNN